MPEVKCPLQKSSIRRGGVKMPQLHMVYIKSRCIFTPPRRIASILEKNSQILIMEFSKKPQLPRRIL
jgi:hypothetical protein